jgi:hypothetical protein
MAALQTFKIGHILFRISILVGSVVLLLWISKSLVYKILMEKSNRKKSTVRDTRYDYLLQAIEFSGSLFFYVNFPTRIILESFNNATVHLNGCARRRARIFSPRKKIKFSTTVTRTNAGIIMVCCMVYSIDRHTIGFPYKRRYGVRTQYSTRSFDRAPRVYVRWGTRRCNKRVYKRPSYQNLLCWLVFRQASSTEQLDQSNLIIFHAYMV